MLFENILTPMPTNELPPAEDFVLQPVTQVDKLLREAGIPIDGVSDDGRGWYRIDFSEGATSKQKAAARELLKGREFKALKPTTVEDVASRLTDDQVAGAMRHAAAREFLANADLAKQLKVDIYVPAESPLSADPDDQRLAESAVQRR